MSGPNDAMKPSDVAIALIKRFEGFCAKVYTCPAGKPTIGYGHVVKPGFDCPGGRRFHFTEPSGNEFAVWSDQRV